MNWDSLQLIDLNYSFALALNFWVPFFCVIAFFFIFILLPILVGKSVYSVVSTIMSKVFSKKNKKSINLSFPLRKNFQIKQSEHTVPLETYSPSASPIQEPYFWDTGRTGERYTREALAYLEGQKRFLSNCYIPKDDGTFTEIDLILIHESGIYVLESKNYSGWIFGSENQKQWIQSLPSSNGQSKKIAFLNPIIQNKVHLKWLRKYLDIGSDIPVYSYIVFSDRCELKEISLITSEHVVINRRNLLRKIRRNAELVGRKLSLYDIDSFYKRLYPLTQVTEEQKVQHIKSVKGKKHSVQRAFSNTNSKPLVSDTLTLSSVTETVRKCPRCGGVLVLRTAKRGNQAGQRFWGCSNYPKCRFVENIDSSSV